MELKIDPAIERFNRMVCVFRQRICYAPEPLIARGCLYAFSMDF
jgi:hypothetical protein